MIIIDGRESSVSVSSFSNLEEVLVNMMKEDGLESRIVTDVFLNDKVFSELYPHQAEDITSSDIKRLEVCTVSLEEMAQNIVVELPKVVKIINSGSKNIANAFREMEIADGLELLQDMIAVSRDFINTVFVLRNNFSTGVSSQLESLGNNFSELLTEVGDAMADEDWMLVADLFEYEFIPASDSWGDIIDSLAKDISAIKEQ